MHKDSSIKKETLKRAGKIIVKSLFAMIIIGAFGLPFVNGGLKDMSSPLSRDKITKRESLLTKTFALESIPEDKVFDADDLLPNIKDFVTTPEGGLPWKIIAQTNEIPYSYTDAEGEDWEGVKPDFSPQLKQLDGTQIIIQGYMFPLSQEEGQTLFLLGPFPLTCPFHYHVTPSLIIEVHTKTPESFSYDAINVSGTLELVPNDAEYNVFYRINDAKISTP